MPKKNEAARNPFTSTSAKRHPWRLYFRRLRRRVERFWMATVRSPSNDGVSLVLPWRILLLLNGRDNEPSARDNAPNLPPPVIARAEGPWQSIGFHPRDDVSLPFLPERRMAIPDYRASLLGLVKKAKYDCPGGGCTSCMIDSKC
jgi:hypothetical protein